MSEIFECLQKLLTLLNLQKTNQRNRPYGRAITRLPMEREVRGSNLGPVKSDTELPTALHHCDISS